MLPIIDLVVMVLFFAGLIAASVVLAGGRDDGAAEHVHWLAGLAAGTIALSAERAIGGRTGDALDLGSGGVRCRVHGLPYLLSRVKPQTKLEGG